MALKISQKAKGARSLVVVLKTVIDQECVFQFHPGTPAQMFRDLVTFPCKIFTFICFHSCHKHSSGRVFQVVVLDTTPPWPTYPNLTADRKDSSRCCVIQGCILKMRAQITLKNNNVQGNVFSLKWRCKKIESLLGCSNHYLASI